MTDRIDCHRESPYWAGARPFPRPVPHPVFYTEAEIERARRRVSSYTWAKQVLTNAVSRIHQSGILDMSEAAICEGIFDQVSFPLPRCPVDRAQRSWRERFWAWSADDPLHVKCLTCGAILPGSGHAPTGEVEIVGPSGKAVTYRYWEDEEGIRYFFDNIVYGYRQEQITGLAGPLALVYTLTGDKHYARRAAVILARITEVYPHYPVHGLGQGFASADHKGYYENHFYKNPPFPFVSARWGNFHDSPYADAGRAFNMAQVYDQISNSGVIEELSEEYKRDVRVEIERDLLYEAARHTLEVPYRATNYDGSRIMGLGLVGRMLGEPMFVEAAYNLFQTLIDNGFVYDGYWHENTLNYFGMIVGGVLRVPEVLGGLGGIDVYRKMPFLPQIYTAPLGLFFPDGRGVPVNDSWSPTTLPRAGGIEVMGRFVEAADEALALVRIPAADPIFALFRRSSETDRLCAKDDLLSLVPENALLPGTGEAMLGVGRTAQAVRVAFSFGPWGGHHHRDTLGMSVYALGQELLSDIGYTWTVFRPWTTSVASHNTVVVDKQEQTEAGGRLLGYSPTSKQGIGFVSAEAPDAFGNTRIYRRSLLLVPTGPESGYLVDVFEIEGGTTHDYLLHGAADFDQTAEVDLVLTSIPGLGTGGTTGAKYDYIQKVKSAEVAEDFKVRLVGESTNTDAWFVGASGAQLLVGEGPSVRRAVEDDARLREFWRPVICLRRMGEKSRFLTVIEAHWGEGMVQEVELLSENGAGVVLRVTEKKRVCTIAIDPTGEGFSTRLPDGQIFELAGRVGVLTQRGGQAGLELIDGSRLSVGAHVIERVRDYQGILSAVVGDLSGQPDRWDLLTDVLLPVDGSLSGRVLYAIHIGGAETAYLIDRVEREGQGSRICLAGMPRFVWGHGTVQAGFPGRFESNVEQPSAWSYAKRRVRVGGRTFAICRMTGLNTFEVEEAFDFSQAVGEIFEVFSTMAGDRFRIVC